MKNLEWTFVDKSKFGDGEWQSEPDKIQWQDAATGLPCLIVRGGGGALCGYVGLSVSHPLYGKNYGDIDESFDVHGGLTYSNYCTESEHGICHIVEPGEPERAYWLGFDCSHSGDLRPSDHAMWIRHPSPWRSAEQYRNVEYVKAQCAALAFQLREYAKQ